MNPKILERIEANCAQGFKPRCYQDLLLDVSQLEAFCNLLDKAMTVVIGVEQQQPNTLALESQQQHTSNLFKRAVLTSGGEVGMLKKVFSSLHESADSRHSFFVRASPLLVIFIQDPFLKSRESAHPKISLAECILLSLLSQLGKTLEAFVTRSQTDISHGIQLEQIKQAIELVDFFMKSLILTSELAPLVIDGRDTSPAHQTRAGARLTEDQIQSQYLTCWSVYMWTMSELYDQLVELESQESEENKMMSTEQEESSDPSPAKLAKGLVHVSTAEAIRFFRVCAWSKFTASNPENPLPSPSFFPGIPPQAEGTEIQPRSFSFLVARKLLQVKPLTKQLLKSGTQDEQLTQGDEQSANPNLAPPATLKGPKLGAVPYVCDIVLQLGTRQEDRGSECSDELAAYLRSS